jgi:hypothetical protein
MIARAVPPGAMPPGMNPAMMVRAILSSEDRKLKYRIQNPAMVRCRFVQRSEYR